MTRASVIIPAHNEAGTIARALHALRQGLGDEDLDVVVVCNGCTDNTAQIARRADPTARVLEIGTASKIAALEVGDAATSVYPRVYLDVDVELSGDSLERLVSPLRTGQVLATAPARLQPLDDCSFLVRSYYEVWERLPRVTSGLFGRGVVAISEVGGRRLASLPRVMNDDLMMSEAFSPEERRVMEGARVVVHPPRTLRDLLQRRTRVVTGNHQVAALGVTGSTRSTGVRTLVRLAATDPGLALRLPVFVGVSGVARVMARSAIHANDFHTWRRDESSRR